MHHRHQTGPFDVGCDGGLCVLEVIAESKFSTMPAARVFYVRSDAAEGDGVIVYVLKHDAVSAL